MKIKVLELKNEPDDSGDIMSTDAIVEFLNRVPLVQDFTKERIGYANLIREGNNFFIKNIEPVTLTKTESGEILSKEEFIDMIKPTTPAIGGTTFERNGNIIKKFNIRVVSLNMSQNQDQDIKTIGEQLDED